MSVVLSAPEVLGTYNGQQLAYIGDAVHSLYARLAVLKEGRGQKASHLKTVGHVNAAAQAKALQAILPCLSDQEKEVVRKGRNAHGRKTAPRSATVSDYNASSGFEALLGFLYLTGQIERLETLFFKSHHGGVAAAVNDTASGEIIPTNDVLEPQTIHMQQGLQSGLKGIR